jgi:chaperonin cofactor prefoldin
MTFSFCFVFFLFFFCSSLPFFFFQKKQDQLRSQCAVLLPGAAEIEEFVRNFSQLSDSVASTLHALPVASECNEEELSAALREVSEEFSLLPESAPIAVQTGDDLTKTASTVREELDALLRCRELLISLELKLAQKHSAMIDEIESKNELAK